MSYQWQCKTCGYTWYENRDYVQHRLSTGHDRTYEELDAGVYRPPTPREPLDDETI